MAELTADQLQSLTSGGDCPLHSHSADRVVTHEQVLAFQGSEATRVVSGDYALTYDDDFIFVEAAAPVALQLPTARGGKSYTMVKISGASLVTILPGAADSINGTTSKIITDSFVPVRIKVVKGHGWIEV